MRQSQQGAGGSGPGRGAGASASSPSAGWCATVAGLAAPGYLALLTAFQWLASPLLALAGGLPSASLAHPVGVSETAVILLEAGCNLLALTAAGLWAARQARLRPGALRLGAARRRKTRGFAEAAFAPAFLAGSLLLGAAGAALGRRLGLPAKAVTLPAGGGALTASYLALCLVPAAGEEAFFRGVLPAVLRPLGPRAAVWGAALLFALAHGSLPQCLAALWAGLALGWYARRRGSVWPGAALHLAHNTFNFCGSRLQSHAAPEAAAALTAAYLVALAVWLAAALLGARRAARAAGQTAARPPRGLPRAQRAAKPARDARRGHTGPLRALQTLFACPGYRLAVLGLTALMLWRWLR